MASNLDRPLYATLLVQAGCLGLLYLLSPVAIPLAAAILLFFWLAAAVAPQSTIALLVLTLPLFHHPLSIGDSQFAPSEILTVIAVAGAPFWLGRQFLADRAGAVDAARDAVYRLARSPLVVTLTILCAVGALYIIWPYDAETRSAGFREWRWTLVEPLLFIGLLITCTRKIAHRNLIVWSFMASGFIVALSALADLATGSGLGVSGVTRLEGLFPHPNALALYLMRPAVIGLALVAFTNAWRTVWVAPLAVSLAALVGSFARSALVALAVVAIALRRTLSVRLQIVAAAAGAVGAAALLVIARDRLLSAGGGGSLSLRVEIWKSALAMIRDRPLTGYGPDQFLYAYNPRYVDPSAWAERFTSHGHNFIADSWIRLGIIGAVFAIIAVVISLHALVRASRNPTPADPVPAAAAIALGAAALQGMVDNGYYQHELAMSAWLLAWLVFGARPFLDLRGTKHDARSRNGRSRARWLAPM